jgi:type 1 glutamine amidotransferase
MKTRPLLVLASLFTATVAFAQDAKPLKVMLITGGCCHDYKAQTEILKTGIEKRINATVTQVHVDDKSTKPALPIYGNPDYAAGYDVVIHDECAADISDIEIVKGVLKPHDEGIPAVALHCAMHSYRTGDFRKKVETLGEDGSLWFEFLGLQSSGHGPQKPIDISYTDKEHPATKGLEDWTTINEELYNNHTVFDTAHVLAKGKQGDQEAVVTWTNDYKGTKVFNTTIGHNNFTVEDPRYLDLVTRGLLWVTGKLDAEGNIAEGYAPVKASE